MWGAMCVRHAPKCAGDAMRTLTLGPQVVLPEGRDPCEGCADTSGGSGMRALSLGPSVELLEGHDLCEGCAEVGGGMQTLSLGPWVEFIAGYDPCDGCAEMGGGRFAKLLSGAVSAVLCGHDPWEGCAEIGGGMLCDFRLGDRKGSSLWGAIGGKSVPTWAGRCYTNCVSWGSAWSPL